MLIIVVTDQCLFHESAMRVML